MEKKYCRSTYKEKIQDILERSSFESKVDGNLIHKKVKISKPPESSKGILTFIFFLQDRYSGFH